MVECETTPTHGGSANLSFWDIKFIKKKKTFFFLISNIPLISEHESVVKIKKSHLIFILLWCYSFVGYIVFICTLFWFPTFRYYNFCTLYVWTNRSCSFYLLILLICFFSDVTDYAFTLRNNEGVTKRVERYLGDDPILFPYQRKDSGHYLSSLKTFKLILLKPIILFWYLT